MPGPSQLKLSPSKLRKAYKQDLAAAWTLARRRHANQTPYAFVLWGLEGGHPQFTPVVLTEEGLTQVANRYVEQGYHDTLEEARKALRYSIGDSPYVSELEETTPTVHALVDPHAEGLDDDKTYAVLAKAAIAALKELDSDGFFSTEVQRDQLLLMIVTEDTPTDWSKTSARQLNPPPVFERFETATKVEGMYADSDAIAVSADGASLYSAGSRHNPEDQRGGRNEFISGLVAYDLIGHKLTRRWAFEFTVFGDSIRAVACSPDGCWVYALRSTYVNGVCKSTVLRFPRNSNQPNQKYETVGEPRGFALSADGQCVVLTLSDKTVHVLDFALVPLRSHVLDREPHEPVFLIDGSLLVPTDTGVLQLDPRADRSASVATPLRAFHLATDGRGSMLAVARWFPFSGPERDKPTEFGIHLLRLPSFELIRTVVVAGHQAVTPALSSNGRLLAFQAHQIGTPRKFVVIVNTDTGEEVGRRKSDFVNDLCFLPGDRTLAITSTGITTTAPIDLWSFGQQ